VPRKIIVYGNQDRNSYPTNNNVAFNNNALFQINDITVTTNLAPRDVINYNDKYHVDSTTLSLRSMNISSIEDSLTYSNFFNRVVLSFDRKNLNNYAYFGSLYDLIKSSVSEIITKWKGSLYIDFFYNGQLYTTANNYIYNPITNKSSFIVNAFLIQNKFELNYVKNTSLNVLYDDIKDITSNYKVYEIWYVDVNGDEQSFPLINFTGSTDFSNGYLNIVAEGNVFPSGSTNVIQNFHIRPIESEYLKFYSELNTLQKYLLNKESTPQYTAVFKILEEDIEKNISFKDLELTWLTSDGYNIDIDTIQYGQYLDALLTIAQSYDKYKSDLIVRFLASPSIIDYDNTENGNMEKLLRVYGREFDEIKSFIDGLTYVNRVSYDKVENIPDMLIKNLAQNLGWNAFNIVDEKDIIDSLFSFDKSKELGVYSTPYEIDIELWRRIIINTNWFFKAKGTRKAVEAIFSFIGAPDCLIDFNEHIYLADEKINIGTVNKIVLDKYNPNFTRLPYDSDGFPKAPNETPGFYFQISGNTDSGQQYINLYRDLSYDVTKTVDNRKSWTYHTGYTARFDELTQTSYGENDSRLIVNTKEVSINLDIARAIECDVYNFNYANDYPVAKNGRAFPYPNKPTSRFDVSQLTFAEYIQQVYSKFIDATNRKIIDDTRGGGYPTLTKLYNDYLNHSLIDTGTQSNARTLGFMLEYIQKFDKVWPRFVDQLIPATTIFDGGGEKYRNTIFTPQKFVYKAGVDAGSEFNRKQNSNIEDDIQVVKIVSTVTTPANGSLNIYKSLGSYNYSPNSTLGNDNGSIGQAKTILNYWANQKWDYNLCSFEQPSFTVSGASKIVQSSFTQDSIFYYDINSGKTLNFIFNDSQLDYGSGSTRNFYTLNKYNKVSAAFDKQIIYEKELTGYTISGTSFVYGDNIQKSFLSRDSEYLVKVKFQKPCYGDTLPCIQINEFIYPYEAFYIYDYLSCYLLGNVDCQAISTCLDMNDLVLPNVNLPLLSYISCYLQDNDPNASLCDFTGTTFVEDFVRYLSAATPYNMYENFDFNLYRSQYGNSTRFFDITKYPAYILSAYTINTTFNYDVIDYLPFKYYVHEFDYFFVSVGSPSTPFNIIPVGPTDVVCDDYQLITENIPVIQGMTAFTTTYNPIGDIQVAVRGLVRIPLEEYYQDTSFLSILQKRYILNMESLNYLDTLTVTYITDGSGSNVAYKCESLVISGITSGGTKPLGEKFFYNTGTTQYEYFLDSGVTSVNNINLAVRGQVLANGIDFTLSIFDNKRILFNVGPFLDGDEIVVCYVTQYTIEQVYQLGSNPYPFTWQIANPIPLNEIGRFYQEFTTLVDVDFNALVYSSTTTYIIGASNFNGPIDFTATPLTLGATYRYRVVSEREYTTISNNVLTIKAYSDDIVVKLPS
jgi:hypothetical protein